MYILITLTLFILKFLAIGVVGLFLNEDLSLTKSAGSIYYIYAAIGITSFISLFLFLLGRRFLWLFIFLGSAFLYIGMYNAAPQIAEIHQKNNLSDHYFKDSATFLSRMPDVINYLIKEQQ